MDNQLIFATSNVHKLNEVRKILAGKFEIEGLDAISFQGEIPENQDTIEGNAIQKVEFIAGYTNRPVFAEDTGLIVPVLNGAPGVHSARYAGAQKSDTDNVRKLLSQMEIHPNHRQAHFKTVIAYRSSNGTIHTFSGEVHGVITTEALGTGGFGYDPVFRPEGYELTFAQLDEEIKNTISHRRRAMDRFIGFLST